MIPFQRPDWFDRAACRGLDPDLFFPERGQPTRPAKRVCERCPVRVECLDYAQANFEKFGVWGGLSERARRRIRARRAPAPRQCQWASCGATFQPDHPSQWYCDVGHQRAAAGARKVARGRRAG